MFLDGEEATGIDELGFYFHLEMVGVGGTLVCILLVLFRFDGRSWF